MLYHAILHCCDISCYILFIAKTLHSYIFYILGDNRNYCIQYCNAIFRGNSCYISMMLYHIRYCSAILYAKYWFLHTILHCNIVCNFATIVFYNFVIYPAILQYVILYAIMHINKAYNNLIITYDIAERHCK